MYNISAKTFNINAQVKICMSFSHSSARVNNHVSQVDRLEDELVSEQEKFKAITEELEQTFAEMSGY